MKKITFILVLVFGSVFVFAQSGRIKGEMGVGFSAGIGDRIMAYQLEYYYNVLSPLSLNAAIYTTQVLPSIKESSLYSISRYGLDISVHYSPLVLSGRVFFTPFLGIGVAYFTANYASELLSSPELAKFSALGGGEIEVRVSRKIFIYLAGDTHYTVGSEYGNWWPTGRLGVRVSL